MAKIHNGSNLFVHIIVFQSSINIPLCCFHCFFTVSQPKPILCDADENGEVREEIRAKGIGSVDERLGANEHKG